MQFSSDNWAGAHPAVSAALSANAAGFDAAYGAGALDRRVEEKFNAIFERDVSVFLVGTGTAANSLALALHSRPGGMTFCHSGAHIMEDECGAPEFLSAGGRLRALDGPLGKFTAESLRAAVSRYFPQVVHDGRATAVSITQSTEAGTIHAVQEIAAIANVAKEFGLALHMDGARFANALVALDATPAEMTWKSGVDILSFGGTKNGCWCAEAIIMFDPARAEEMTFLRKRSAQLFSKSRFMAAQFDGYLADGLWLDNARHANAMASALAALFRTSDKARLAWEPEANEVFAILRTDAVEAARAAGAGFYEWRAPADIAASFENDEAMYRFVTSFATKTEDVDRLAATLSHL